MYFSQYLCFFLPSSPRTITATSGFKHIDSQNQSHFTQSHTIISLFLVQGDPSEGTSIEFVGQLLDHPIAKQLMVQERLVELAKKVSYIAAGGGRESTRDDNNRLLT